MPLLEIVQTSYVSATIRLSDTTAELIDKYAAFLHAPADDVVDKALAYVFAKDRDFQEYLRTPEAAHAPHILRARRLGRESDGAEPSNGSAKPARSAEAGHDARPRSRDGAV